MDNIQALQDSAESLLNSLNEDQRRQGFCGNWPHQSGKTGLSCQKRHHKHQVQAVNMGYQDNYGGAIDNVSANGPKVNYPQRQKLGISLREQHNLKKRSSNISQS